MKSGNRDRLVTIERNSGTTENAFGEVVENWASYCTAWCEVIYGSGQERRDAGLEGADQPATFRTLASTETLAVTVADRINFDGFYWDITNVSPLDRDGVEWTAIRRASA